MGLEKKQGPYRNILADLRGHNDTQLSSYLRLFDFDFSIILANVQVKDRTITDFCLSDVWLDYVNLVFTKTNRIFFNFNPFRAKYRTHMEFVIIGIESVSD